mmetsp:Transcript_26550/g.74984  ORF Transcript_26550/g.74984 Transcript_26550/m.74984 type:complete len:222 (+) Transcript_26550:539-1204(+)
MSATSAEALEAAQPAVLLQGAAGTAQGGHAGCAQAGCGGSGRHSGCCDSECLDAASDTGASKGGPAAAAVIGSSDLPAAADAPADARVAAPGATERDLPHRGGGLHGPAHVARQRGAEAAAHALLGAICRLAGCPPAWGIHRPRHAHASVRRRWCPQGSGGTGGGSAADRRGRGPGAARRRAGGGALAGGAARVRPGWSAWQRRCRSSCSYRRSGSPRGKS